MIISKKHSESKSDADQEQSWENPVDPKRAEDERDVEQLLRQKKEAERRKENLSADDENQGDD